MGTKDFDQALVLATIFFQSFELVTTRTESTTGGVLECGNRAFAFFACVDQVFQQGADYTVAAGIDLADHFAFAGSFDNARGGGIDNGGDTTGLGIKGIFTGILGHLTWAPDQRRANFSGRSEERRVGKEWRYRGTRD